MLPIKSNLIPTISRFLEYDWKNLFDWSFDKIDQNSYLPAIYISELPDQFIIEMDTLGYDDDSLKVNYQDHTLEISVVNVYNESEGSDGQGYAPKSLKRVLKFNSDMVNGSEISIQFIDGILKLAIPKGVYLYN